MLLVSMLLGGCRRASRDAQEEHDSLLNKAIELKKAEEIDQAIHYCKKSLERKPKLASAHLELAGMYDFYQEDYVRAIYHYERYLELRPDSQKRKLIEDVVRQARLNFASSVPDVSNQALAELAKLKNENKQLRSQIIRLKQEVQLAGRDAVSRQGGASITRASGRGAATSAAETRRYTVKPGDTLTKISGQMYGTNRRYKEIYKANQDKMKNENDLRSGLVLTIPE